MIVWKTVRSYVWFDLCSTVMYICIYDRLKKPLGPMCGSICVRPLCIYIYDRLENR